MARSAGWRLIRKNAATAIPSPLPIPGIPKGTLGSLAGAVAGRKSRSKQGVFVCLFALGE